MLRNLASRIDAVSPDTSVAKKFEDMDKVEKYMACARIAAAIDALFAMKIIKYSVREDALFNKGPMREFDTYYYFDDYDERDWYGDDYWDYLPEYSEEYYKKSNRDKARERRRRNTHKGCQCAVMRWKVRSPRFK